MENGNGQIIKIENEFATLHRNQGDYEIGLVEQKVELGRLMDEIESARGGILVETPILPQGTKYYCKDGNSEIIVVEHKPKLVNMKVFIDHRKYSGDDSGTYRVSIPYTIFVLYFWKGQLTDHGFHIFYRNEPLSLLDDKLSFANLFNTYLHMEYDGWVCLGGNNINLDEVEIDQKTEKAIERFWNSEFNSDGAGNRMGFTFSRSADARIETLFAWQAASALDPSFILRVPWKETGNSLRGIIEQITKREGKRLEYFKQKKTFEHSSQIADVMYRTEEVE
jgi:hypothetical protein